MRMPSSAGMRAHLRGNLVGYVALFFSLGLGTAWANHEQIFSNDIVNGEVKVQDIGAEAVGSDEVAANSLEAGDLASDSVGWIELSGGAFHPSDIGIEPEGFTAPFGIKANAIQSHEIENGQVGRADLAAGAGPAGFSFSDTDTGIICNGGCVEGSLSLPAGSYAIFAKIRARQPDGEKLHVNCDLHAGGDSDHAFVRVVGDSGGSPGSNTAAMLPMQLLHDFASPGTASVSCEDQDVGDVTGGELQITAIKLGSTTP